MKHNTWWQDAGFEIALFIAGVLGAISNINNQKLSLWQKLLAFISGGAIANYLTPLVFIYLNLNENTKFGIAFLLGFSGMEGVKFIIIKAKDIFKTKTK
jgi:predicted MFS family arabinose efflux permease